MNAETPIRSRMLPWAGEGEAEVAQAMRLGMSDEDVADSFNTAGATDSRDATGVPHLDEVLGGGLRRGALVLIMGLPGSGKTTLASQIACAAARNGKTALILTALSESTAKLIVHLRSFSFFDPELIGGPIQFLSLQGTLSQGLPATATAILAAARRIRADVVVLDGFRGMRSVDTDPQAAREFLYTVRTTLSTLGATTIIASETDPRDPAFFPETTTADVILGLHYSLLGARQFRGIEVIKARTTAPLPGQHALTLSSDGVTVYPQFEERVAASLRGADAETQGAAQRTGRAMTRPSASRERATFGLTQLDAMLSGGIPRATCTLLAGSLGTGKTLLAIYFAMAGVRAGERVVFLGFRESREQLLQAAEPFAIGAELDRALRPAGGLTFLEVPPIRVNADILADRLLRELDRTGAQRLVIDSIAEVERAILRSVDPQRLEDYLAALLETLRLRQVTGLLVKESDKALAATLDFSSDALSVLAENVLLMRQTPYQGQLHRILSILKLRFSDHDSRLREFRIAAPEGLEVLKASESSIGVLEGITRNQELEAVAQQREAAQQHVRRRRPSSVRRSGGDE